MGAARRGAGLRAALRLGPGQLVRPSRGDLRVLGNLGRALAVEHNGDLYSCDHYVYPRYKLGNLLNTALAGLVYSPQQQAFGLAKSATLPCYCRECPVRFARHGECPKHRFIRTPGGEPGLNYLCAGYKKFFTHIDSAIERVPKTGPGGMLGRSVV